MEERRPLELATLGPSRSPHCTRRRINSRASLEGSFRFSLCARWARVSRVQLSAYATLAPGTPRNAVAILVLRSRKACLMRPVHESGKNVRRGKKEKMGKKNKRERERNKGKGENYRVEFSTWTCSPLSLGLFLKFINSIQLIRLRIRTGKYQPRTIEREYFSIHFYAALARFFFAALPIARLETLR